MSDPSPLFTHRTQHPYIHMIAAQTWFIQEPLSVANAVYNSIAAFFCTTPCIGLWWTVNDLAASAVKDQGITYENSPIPNGITSILYVPATSANNNTKIKCSATCEDGDGYIGVDSRVATLTVEGNESHA